MFDFLNWCWSDSVLGLGRRESIFVMVLVPLGPGRNIWGLVLKSLLFCLFLVGRFVCLSILYFQLSLCRLSSCYKFITNCVCCSNMSTLSALQAEGKTGMSIYGEMYPGWR